MFAHAIAVASDIDQVAVMQHPVDECCRHDIISEDLAPFLKALIRGQHGGGFLVAAIHQLEEQHGPGVVDRQIADLIDDQQRGMGQDCEASCTVVRLPVLLPAR